VPSYANLFVAENLYAALEQTPTHWLFSWGRNEHGAYKIEAEERITAQAIEGLPNVEVVIHEEGHVFAVEDIKDMLRRVSISQ